jgi:hypothetical protein
MISTQRRLGHETVHFPPNHATCAYRTLRNVVNGRDHAGTDTPEPSSTSGLERELASG